MIQFGILGPTEVLVGGDVATLGGPRQRAVLVRLLLASGHVVSSERIIDDVWDGRAPASAPKLLQKYVSELRKTLPGLTLRTIGGGYVLDVDPDAVDAVRFERLVDSRDFPVALALWRGTVLSDLPDLAFVTPERTRLQELRLFAIESRIEDDLEAGRHGPAIAELAELVDANPLRERLTCLLMLALYRSGRQVEALRVYERHRRHLAGEIGVVPAEGVRRLEEAILRHDPSLDRPATSSVNRPRGRLPITLTTFVGRTTELEHMTHAIVENRLVTLTGPGGVGKTRLAVELATRLVDDFPGGVWTVDLAGVDESDFTTTLSSALAVDVGHAVYENDRVLNALAHRPACLIVLDNCEHIVEPVAAMTAAMLGAAKHVRVLATSRRPLGVDGEFVRPLQPLPDDEAERLFADRVRLIGFRDVEISRRHAREICQRLDGLPLAIELAASQLRVMGIDDIIERLGNLLAFRGPAQTKLPRQRTLGEMVQWSYGMLEPSTQTTFARLGVFASSLTLAAAESVATNQETDRRTVFDDITTLIDHSLLVRDVLPSSSRYRLLETLRLFALDRLAELGDEISARRAHAEYFLELAQQSSTELYGPQEREWRMRLDAEEANLHAALAWASEHDPLLGLRLAVALWPYWEVRWREREGVAYIERLLSRDLHVPPNLRAWAMTALSAMEGNAGEARLTVPRAMEAVDAQRQLDDELGLIEALAALAMALGNQGQLDRAEAVLAEGLDIAHRKGELQATARLLDRAGFVAGRRGDHARAAQINREELAVMTRLASRRGEATALRHLAISVQHLGDAAQAAELCERALEIWRDVDDPAAVAHVQTTLADIARRSGDLGGAKQIYDEALVQLRAIGDRRCTASTYKNLAAIAAVQGDDDRAAMLYRDGLALRFELGDEAGVAEILEGLARIGTAGGRDRYSAILIGAALGVRERTGSLASRADADAVQEVLDAGRHKLGHDALEAEVARGRELSLADIRDLALQAGVGAAGPVVDVPG
jgi:predicted ATPase